MLFGSVLATILVIVVTVQVALETAYWTIINFITLFASLLWYFTLTYAYYYIFGSSYIGSLKKAMGDANFWFTLFLIIAILILPIIAKRFYFYDIYPTLSDRVRLKQREAKRTHQPQEFHRISSAIRRSRRSLRSGYAFSHQEGFGRLITTGKIMRRGLRAKSPTSRDLGKVVSNANAAQG
ncbi:unnamed protein product, partial [Notodromas monacha]